MLGLQVDAAFPDAGGGGGTAVRVPSTLFVSADIVPAVITRQLGSIGMMVDYVGSAAAVNAARWSGTAFEMGTSSPLTYWSSSAFQTSGSKPVLWVTDHFEIAP